MKFPWQRRAEQAQASASQAAQDLSTVKEQRRHVEKITTEARQARERNHFADAIAALMGDPK